jgi:pyruvate,water dikinase
MMLVALGRCSMSSASSVPLVLAFHEISSADTALVGGKNASLGEMVRELQAEDIRVPPGFATTSAAYWAFVDENDLRKPIEQSLRAYREGERSLAETGRAIRRLFRSSRLPDALHDAILAAYRELSQREDTENLSVAVRSSATAEDLPEASFAGQQESFLNIEGEAELLEACRACLASLFTDRAITYRDNNGFDHLKVALSIGVQKMVRSDQGSAGVLFTLDTETGFPDVLMINAAWGLGENVVKGTVNPDEYYVFKPFVEETDKRPILRKELGEKEMTMIFATGGHRTTRNVRTRKELRRRFALEDDDILLLARWGARIERHYSKRAGKATPMDIEWAKDGVSGELFIVQARPETVRSRARSSELVMHVLEEEGRRLLAGRSVGDAIAQGAACVIRKPSDIERFKSGSILVAEMTDPDWVPIMREAAGIITDHGGRTCHAAIVSRELGIPAVVGTGRATEILSDGDAVTISCAEGEEGYVYEGLLRFRREAISLDELRSTSTKIMVNLASPAGAFQWWRLPVDGIGLARIEFIITDEIRVHPMALAHPELVTDRKVRARIEEACRGYRDGAQFFVEALGRGVAMLAASQYPRPAIVRMSDFKSNEYAELLGGSAFEHKEENPMLGLRGASRYYSDSYRDAFALECRAMRYARETLGFTNIVLMIPFCRTPEEADRVLSVLAEEGLRRGEGGLKVYVMCEIPSNVILAEEFAKRFDGFSIGSNDLTQLVLGVDRDSEVLAPLFDERSPAVKAMIAQVITEAHRAGKPVGICGEAPSDYPGFAEFLVEAGIDSISLNPDSVIGVRRRLSTFEEERGETQIALLSKSATKNKEQ